MYRGRLISMPSMFFIFEQCGNPLVSLDINAWLVLAQVTGDLPLPTPEEMARTNMKVLLNTMNDPFFRYGSDYVSHFCIFVYVS